MLKAWKPSRTFNTVEIKPNLYIFFFENREDKAKVIRGRPWLLDSHFPTIQPFDGYTPPLKLKFKHKKILCSYARSTNGVYK